MLGIFFGWGILTARLALLLQWFWDRMLLSSLYTSVCTMVGFGVFGKFLKPPKSHRGDLAFWGGWALPVVVLPRGVPRALRSRLNVGHAGSNPGAPFLCYFRVVLVSRRGKALPILPGAVRMRAEWRRMAQMRADSRRVGIESLRLRSKVGGWGRNSGFKNKQHAIRVKQFAVGV